MVAQISENKSNYILESIGVNEINCVIGILGGAQSTEIWALGRFVNDENIHYGRAKCKI